jgi:hypothetical protein
MDSATGSNVAVERRLSGIQAPMGVGTYRVQGSRSLRSSPVSLGLGGAGGSFRVFLSAVSVSRLTKSRFPNFEWESAQSSFLVGRLIMLNFPILDGDPVGDALHHAIEVRPFGVLVRVALSSED